MNKTEKNKKLSRINKLKKIKKNIKGITLIALVVTVIVLLILAGVALNLTIGQNGIFSRAQGATAIWKNAETNEQLLMGEMDNLINEYKVLTWIDGVPIPDGFYYAGGSKDTGLVISDNKKDEKKFTEDTKTDEVLNTLLGNQFVWVPVTNTTSLFTEQIATLNINEDKVITNIYSNLKVRNLDQSSYTVVQPGDTSSIREPDVLSSFDIDEQYYLDTLGFDSTKDMAKSFVSDYIAMSNSMKKYNGFYVGRYEITSNGEKSGESLTKTNWYDLYKACRNVLQGKENVKTTMIYGVQWDAVCTWLEQSGFDTDSDSSSWGNYSNSKGDAYIEGKSGSKQNTGFSEYWKANNIYDLAGNCWEWTQEASSTNYRIKRAGSYTNTGSGAPASDRSDFCPNDSHEYGSSRATLYIK